MSKSKLGMSSFDIDIKFKDKDEARRYAKRLIYIKIKLFSFFSNLIELDIQL